jgi:hypothetical protein
MELQLRSGEAMRQLMTILWISVFLVWSGREAFAQDKSPKVASRMFASVLYGRSIPEGSMEKSIEYLDKAIVLNPTLIASRLELAQSYVAVENWSLARNLLPSIPELPIQFSDDSKHEHKAAQLLAEIKEH